MDRVTSRLEDPVPLLDQLQLHVAIRFIELLGSVGAFGNESNHISSESPEAERRDQGFKIARNWPGYFYSSLDRILRLSPNSPTSGLLSSYGWIYSELCVGDTPDAIKRLVRPLIRTHAVKNGIISPDEPRLGEGEKFTLPATEVARRLGRSYAITRRLLEKKNAIPSGSRRGVAFTIDPNIIDEVRKPSETHAKSVLGIGRKQSRAITTNPQIRALVGNCANLPERVCEVIFEKVDRHRSDGVRLSTACRNMGVPIDVACLAILAGHLSAGISGDPMSGLKCLTVLPQDLGPFRRRNQLFQKPTEIARHYRIHPETARFLARNGMFGTNDRRGFGADSVSAFFGKYICGAQLAKDSNTSSRFLRDQMAAMGVSPRFGPPTCRQIIYLKADLLDPM